MARTALFRVDGNVQIGTGHVMRCVTLADGMSRHDIGSVFVSRSPDAGLAKRIVASGHRLWELSNSAPSPDQAQGHYGQWLGTTQRHDAEATLYAAGELGLSQNDLVVVDHYGLDLKWETLIKGCIGAPVLAIDDIERHHTADVVLDTTFGKSQSAYAGLVPNTTDCLIGARYALLRPDFASIRDGALAARDIRLARGDGARSILIAMGGSDAQDATGWVLDGIMQLLATQQSTVHVLVGASYPHRDRLAARQHLFGSRLVVHSDVWEMAVLLAGMDLAIGAAGSSAWERCCMGLPTIQLVLADNQRTIAEKLAAHGAAEDGGIYAPDADPVAWAQRILMPMLATARLQAASRISRHIVDGDGVARVIKTLLSNRTGP